MESIQTVSNISVPFSQILQVSNSGGSLSVPVSNASVINTSFKHITGVPLLSEESNISYSKLRQLDMLIDQISKLRNSEMDASIDVGEIEKDQFQIIIDNLAYELGNRINSEQDFYSSIYSVGSILNMTA